ncbi:uncharacterized protein [Ptychodera flava]|uniref:uncharacterized protein n=1 Tax=Ptychodera flava TaxID=63121 RepID=UPI00396A585A
MAKRNDSCQEDGTNRRRTTVRDLLETKVTLTRAVKSVIVAYASTSAQISADQVSCAGRHNFWSVKQEVLEKDGEGDVICTRQKPLQLYEHLIKEFTPPGSWMLDGICGAGTAVIAGLLNDVSVVGIDTDERCISHCKVRCESLLGLVDSGDMSDME